MRFAIFTHVLHSKQAGEYFAYPPYVREMNIWLRQVDEVEVIGTRRKGDEGTVVREEQGIAYEHSNLTFTVVPSFNLLSISAAVKAILKIPNIAFKIMGAMRRADQLHLRCPGNVGLLACICQIFFPNKPKTAKYAGNWDPEAKQPWSYNLQKWILTNTFLTRNMTVLVYGNWPNQTKNILPFFTASFCDSDKEVVEKDFNRPIKFLFVGNLVPGKQPLLALQLVEALREKNIEAKFHVYGEGELEGALKEKAKNKTYIQLHGNQPLEVLKQAYKESHFLILASKSEGWPKAVAEAMFFGCIPIATAVSCVPWMLAAAPEGGAKNVTITKRGILIPDLGKGEKVKVDGQDLLGKTVDGIIELTNDQEEMKRMSMEAQTWSQEYTLERFEEEIKKLLVPKEGRP